MIFNKNYHKIRNYHQNKATTKTIQPPFSNAIKDKEIVLLNISILKKLHMEELNCFV